MQTCHKRHTICDFCRNTVRIRFFLTNFVLKWDVLAVFITEPTPPEKKVAKSVIYDIIFL